MVKKDTGKRGRPPLYFGVRKEAIVSLLKDHGASRTMEILNTKTTKKSSKETLALAALRPASIKEALTISLPTLLGMAKEAGIKLQRGRPKLEKAEAPAPAAKKASKPKAKKAKKVAAPVATDPAPADPVTDPIVSETPAAEAA